MKPLKIKAVLSSGFASSFEWSPSIDGIIAYQFMQEKLGADEFIETHGLIDTQEPVSGLPLEVEKFNGDWWYKSSSPIYSAYCLHKTHIHRRFNSSEAERHSHSKTSKIQTTKGPYKNARILVTKRITPEVVWHAVGDAEECKRLLSGVTHIGAQRRSGFGAVKEWVVTENGDENLARFNRPLPKEFAEENKIEGMILEWPIRPPSRHPDNLRVCIIPVSYHAG